MLLSTREKKIILLTLMSGILVGFVGHHLLFQTGLITLEDPYPPQHMIISQIVSHKRNEEFHKLEDDSLAVRLKGEVRVLCWVMTNPSNHQSRAEHVKRTWGKRCNYLLFMSSEKDDSLPTIKLDVKEGREYLWRKTKEAFKYIYKHYLHRADWFLKADDDTYQNYIIVENLRYMLRNIDTNTPIYYGNRFKPYVKQGYMSGGAGYVLSKEAVKRFIEIAIHNQTLCKQADDGSEDVEIGLCLENVGVAAGDSRDSLHRHRFFCFDPGFYVMEEKKIDKTFWFWQYIYYNNSVQGRDCCSDNAISFHYMNPNQMYQMEYFVYHLKPYGITYNYNN